jgi:hypothetical protein
VRGGQPAGGGGRSCVTHGPPLHPSLRSVLEFGGYASLSDMQSAEAALRQYAARDGYTVIADEWQVLYLQYESPFTIFNRHNEVRTPTPHCLARHATPAA